MPGMFDDLIEEYSQPQQSAARPASTGMFDDLIAEYNPGPGRYATEFGKGVVEGAKGVASSALKGFGAAAPVMAQQQIEALDQINAPLPEEDQEDPFARAAYRQRRAVQHPADEVIAERRAALEPIAAMPVAQQPLYRAGEALEGIGKEAMAPAPGFEGSWTRDIGSGFGSVATGAGLAMVPGVGPAAAGAAFIGSGAGEAAERAVKAGASEDQIRRAAELGSIAGATDVVDALLPALGSTGKALGLIRRVGSRALMGALAEGGQEGLQQTIQNWIARGVYKPDQDLFEDVPRSALIGAIVGGGVSGGLSAAEGRGQAQGNAQINPQTAQPGAGITPEVPAAPTQTITAPAPQIATPITQDAPPSAPPEVLPSTPAAPSPEIPGNSLPAAPAAAADSEHAALRAAGYSDAEISVMSRADLDTAIDIVGEGGQRPAAAPAPDPAAVTRAMQAIQGLQAEPAPAPVQQAAAPVAAPQEAPAPITPAPPPELPGRPIPNPSLQDMLNDPRSAAEIRAEMEAAKNWQPSGEWQAVPRGVTLNPALQTKTEDGQTLARLAPTPGTKAAPVALETPEAVHAGAEITQAEPSPAQIEAGNFAKRHLKWRGRDISIETEANATRTAADGSWSVVMPVPYGHILGTRGRDGDPIDVFVGPNPRAPQVFVIDQADASTGKFDEHKTMVGFPTEAAARAAYEASFSDGRGPDRLGAITAMPVAQFRAWLKGGNHNKPVAYVPPVTVKVTRKQARAKGPLNLMQFLAAEGGLAPDPGGELKALNLTGKGGRLMIPGLGFRNLVRPGGRTLDDAWAHAIHNGYINDRILTEKASVTDANELLRMISEGAAGRHTYARGDEAAAAEAEATRAREHAEDQLAGAKADVEAAIKEHGLIASDDQIREAAHLALTEFADGVDAIEHVLYRDAIARSHELEQSQGQEPDNAFADDYARATGTAGPAQPAERERGQERSQVRVPQGREQHDEARGTEAESAKGTTSTESPARAESPESPSSAARAEGPASTVERGADNKPQLVLPGAEKASDADLAQRKTNQPLKPKVAQRPADEGLFSDDSQQDELFSLAPAEEWNLLQNRIRNRARLRELAEREAPQPQTREARETGPSDSEAVAKGLGNQSPDLRGPDYLTPAAKQRQRDIEAMLRQVVEKVAGKAVRVRFESGARLSGEFDTSRGYGSAAEGVTRPRALYMPAERLIQIALGNGAARSSAFHEAWHDLEFHLLNDKQVALLTRETDRMRPIVADAFGLSQKQAADLAGYEVRAMAFETYATAREGSKRAPTIPGQVRVIFDRIRHVLRQIANGLRGLGFKTTEDIFDTAIAGEFANTPDRGARSIDSLAAALPTKQQETRPGIDPIPELLAERLEHRNFPKLARVSRTLGLGNNVNTTELRVKAQDKFLRWQNIGRAASESTGQPLPEHVNTYLAESLYYGKTGQRLEQLDQQHIDPLVEEIKQRSLKLEQVDRFLMARHAPERNRELRKINKDIADPSGMSDAEAKKILDDIDASGKRADYDAIEKRVRDLINQTGETLVASGLISQATLDGWRKAYQNYVPLRGWAEGPNADEEAGFGVGRGLDIRGQESKKALGRSSIADSPLGYVMLQAQQAIVRGEKNRVGQTALRFVQQHADPDLWQVDKGDAKRALDPKTGLVTERSDPSWIHRPNVFAVKVGGEPHYIVFKGEHGADLARALKNLGTANMNTVVRFIGAITRIQARLATSLNPDFMIPNFVRDVGEAFINLQEQDQKKFATRFAKHLFPAMIGSGQALAGKTGGKYADAFREFDQAGGRIRFFGLENVEDIKANVESKMRRLEGGTINTVRSGIEKTVAAIEVANGAVENATRLAVYMAARDVGLSKTKAASIAREMTVNFNRKGELGSMVSSLYMFANASVQGTTRMLSAMRNKRVRRFAYGIAAAGATLALYNLFAGGDDDDGVPYYTKLPFWERDTNLILMWPKGMGHDGKYVKIPLPYGYSFWAVIGGRLATLAAKKEPASKAVPAMLSATLDAFDPLGRNSNPVAQFAPSVARPAIEIATNKSWTGRPITPEPSQFNKHEPDSARHFRNASPFAVSTAETLNRATGGTKREPGLIDWSPGAIDHVLGAVTGGLGRFANNIATTATGLYNGTEWQVEKTPIVRRFYGEKNDQADRALYFDAREKVNAAWERRRGYAKDGDGANLQRFSRENAAEISAHKVFEAVDKQRLTILKRIDGIKANADLPAREKEAQLKIEQDRELALMARARKQLDQLRAAAETE